MLPGARPPTGRWCGSDSRGGTQQDPPPFPEGLAGFQSKQPLSLPFTM